MKFFTKFLPLVLALVAAACSTETNNNGSDASAQADGGSGDGTVVGNDAGDINTASNDVASTDKVDSDTVGQTDVGGGDSDVATNDEADTAKPFCPQAGDPAEATLELALADSPQCFVPDSTEAEMILAFVNAKMDPGEFGHPAANMMPAAPEKPDGTGGCDTIHMPGYCFPIAQVFGKGYKPKWFDLLGPNAGKPFLVVKFPDDSSFPEGGKELVIVDCSLDTCTLSSVYSDGLSNEATYNIATKILSISVYKDKILGYIDEYKLE